MHVSIEHRKLFVTKKTSKTNLQLRDGIYFFSLETKDTIIPVRNVFLTKKTSRVWEQYSDGSKIYSIAMRVFLTKNTNRDYSQLRDCISFF